MHRLPYEMNCILLGRPSEFCLAASTPAAFGMSEELASFISVRGTCARCCAPVGAVERHVTCTSRTLRRPIRVEFGEEELLEFFELLHRESARRKAFKRRSQLSSTKERHTRSQLLALLALQEERCYFCFQPLHTPAGRFVGRKDHFIALANGGGDGIENIVYACPKCNSLKGAQNGPEFRGKKLRAAKGAAKVGLKRIHLAVRAASSNPSIERSSSSRLRLLPPAAPVER